MLPEKEVQQWLSKMLAKIHFAIFLITLNMIFLEKTRLIYLQIFEILERQTNELNLFIET